MRRRRKIDFAAARTSPTSRRRKHGFDPDRLTIGFARRLATYKRLYLLALRPERALGLLGGQHPLQFVFAGKAHPLDDGAKAIVRDLFHLKSAPEVADRVAFLEDYDLSFAAASGGRVRRVGQRASTAGGGERHERDEGGGQRGAEPLRPRRLVG